MDIPVTVAETCFPVVLGGRKHVMRFTANTMVAYEQATGKFFMDTVSSLYEVMFPKGHERKGRPVQVKVSGQDLIRKISMIDLRAMLWASMHDYDKDGEPFWPETVSQVGRHLNFHNVIPIFITFLTGVSSNSPNKEELGERSADAQGQAPTRTMEPEDRRSMRDSEGDGGETGIELPAGALD